MFNHNSIYNADCIEGMKKMADNSVDLIVTDPPYRITSRGNAGNSGGMMQKKLSMKGKIFIHNDCNVKDWLPEAFRVLKDGSHCYIMCNHINLREYLNVSNEVGFHFIKCLIWDKCNKIMGRAYMSQFEYILFLRKGAFKQVNNCSVSDIITISNKKTKDAYGKNYHDTEKPVDLMEVLIRQSSKVKEVVLDPFMGIGTTPLACINTDRDYIGFEIDERYFEISKKRINTAEYNKILDLFNSASYNDLCTVR